MLKLRKLKSKGIENNSVSKLWFGYMMHNEQVLLQFGHLKFVTPLLLLISVPLIMFIQ